VKALESRLSFDPARPRGCQLMTESVYLQAAQPWVVPARYEGQLQKIADASKANMRGVQVYIPVRLSYSPWKSLSLIKVFRKIWP